MPSSHSSLVSLFSSRFFLARGFWKKDGFRNCETVIATVTRGSDDGDDDDDDDDDDGNDDGNDVNCHCNCHSSESIPLRRPKVGGKNPTCFLLSLCKFVLPSMAFCSTVAFIRYSN